MNDVQEMRAYISAHRLEDVQLLQMLHTRAKTLAQMAADSNDLRSQGTADDTRQKIAAMLEKIASENNLNRIYQFVKYIYIHKEVQP